MEPSLAEFESVSSLRKQMYVALRAFEGGLAVSANLVLPGWDTHRNNDLGQARLFNHLFGALIYLRQQAKLLGIADQMNVIVGSDFGRTPYYNSQASDRDKDHHSVTSWMTMLWANELENGLRVIGQTDERVVAAPLNEDLTLAAPEQGSPITPATIHNELRRLGGLNGQPVIDRYFIDAPTHRLWG